ncbi:WD40 repeat domain-containing protein [Thalassoporum mexicanum]|nr:WD40 repeat domain-containing protein [Pseudanabaena sp. PCC 7367]
MLRPTNQPQEFDVALGGGNDSPSTNGATLGGMAAVLKNLKSASIDRRIASLPLALRYDRAGTNLLLKVLTEDQSWQVRRSAYWLLRQEADPRLNPVLNRYNPYHNFRCQQVITLVDVTAPSLSTKFVSQLAISSNSQFLAASSNFNIQVYDLTDCSLLHTIPDYGSIAITNDSKTLVSASGNYDSEVSLWDLATGQPQRSLLADHRGMGIDAIAISPNDQTIAISSSYQGKIKTYSLTSGKLANTHNGQSPLTMNPNGQNFISSSKEGNIKVWSLYSGTLLRTISNQEKEITSIAISPDGQILAAASWDGQIYLWRLMTSDLHNIIQAHSANLNPITTITISPDGNVLATGYHRGIVRLWDLHSGELLKDLSSCSSRISSLVFSADGKKLAIGTWEAKIYIWEIDEANLG